MHRLENTIFVMLNSHENCYAGTNSCFLWNKIIWRQRPTLSLGIRATGKNSPRITFRPNIHNSPSLTVQLHPQTLSSSRRRALSSPPVRKKRADPSSWLWRPRRRRSSPQPRCPLRPPSPPGRSRAALSGRRRSPAGSPSYYRCLRLIPALGHGERARTSQA